MANSLLIFSNEPGNQQPSAIEFGHWVDSKIWTDALRNARWTICVCVQQKKWVCEGEEPCVKCVELSGA
jgi:hypothetical protein